MKPNKTPQILAMRESLRRYGLKRTSVKTYSNSIKSFCNNTSIKIEELLTRDIENIEELTETYIRNNEGILSPKFLNIVYSAIKTWLHCNKRIKGRKHFREIKFDKSSTVENHLLAKALETRDVQKMLNKLILSVR